MRQNVDILPRGRNQARPPPRLERKSWFLASGHSAKCLDRPMRQVAQHLGIHRVEEMLMELQQPVGATGE